MIYKKTASRVSNLLFLALLPIVFAHGDSQDMGKMNMGIDHDSNTTQSPKHQDYPNTYFAHFEHSGVIYAHISLMVISWVFILPIGKFTSATRYSVCFAN